MKLYTKIISITLCLLFILAPAAAVSNSNHSHSQTIYVSTTGNDNNSGLGSFKNAKQHIQSAIDIVKPGDTIKVDEGTYNESITINKHISIIGTNKSIINGNKGHSCIKISENCDVLVEGFIIQHNVPLSDANAFGCGITNRGGLLLKNCEITHNFVRMDTNGIENGGKLVLIHCSIHDNISKKGGMVIFNSNECTWDLYTKQHTINNTPNDIFGYPPKDL